MLLRALAERALSWMVALPIALGPAATIVTSELPGGIDSFGEALRLAETRAESDSGRGPQAARGVAFETIGGDLPVLALGSATGRKPVPQRRSASSPAATRPEPGPGVALAVNPSAKRLEARSVARASSPRSGSTRAPTPPGPAGPSAFAANEGTGTERAEAAASEGAEEATTVAGDAAGAESAPDTAPVATADTVVTAFEAPLAIRIDTDLLANDSDPEGRTLELQSVDSSTQGAPPGSVALSPDGLTLEYVPGAGFAGLDRFSYAVTDGSHSASAEVTVRVGMPWVEETFAAFAEATSSLETAQPLVAAAGQLYLASVSLRGSGLSVTSVQGLGLAWSRLASQCAAYGSIEVWWAIGEPASAGPVSATLSGAAASSQLSVSRISHVDPLAPIGAVSRANTRGVNGSCGAAIASREYGVALATLRPGSVVLGSVSFRHPGAQHDPGAGFSELVEVSSGSGVPAHSALATQSVFLPSSALVQAGGTLHVHTDWATIAVEVSRAP